jgi:hypothetical protein
MVVSIPGSLSSKPRLVPARYCCVFISILVRGIKDIAKISNLKNKLKINIPTVYIEYIYYIYIYIYIFIYSSYAYCMLMCSHGMAWHTVLRVTVVYEYAMQCIA